MSRLPIRLRMTLAFAAAMALVLAGFAVFLYLRTSAQLSESVDDSLELRGSDLASLVASQGANGYTLSFEGLDPEDSFAQVIGPDGAPEFSTTGLGDRPVLSESEIADAAREPLTLERESAPGIDGRARLLATPVDTGRGTAVAVVGSTLEDRDESLAGLALLLAIGGPVALALAGAAGYWVAGRALAPVERMRAGAALITASKPSARLGVPASNDELSRLGSTLNDMLDRLEAGIERERRFVDDASHELRTPLALHKAELELAQEYASDEETLREAIAAGIAEVDRLAQLADDLLVVARARDGELALHTESLRAAELMEGAAIRFGTRADRAGREIVIVPAGDLALRGDRLRLEQALTNLLDNALRHGAGTIELEARATAAVVELHVRDEGEGFPPGFEDRAFDRFSRADASRSGAGTGLGLSIVETIAAAHGGRASLRTLHGHGADVWIEVPAAL